MPVFGKFRDDGMLSRYYSKPQGPLGMPRSSTTVGQPRAFGAFWGRPLDRDEIRVTLYEVVDGTMRQVWSVTKRAKVIDTGFADTVAPTTDPGIYRMEVTRGADVLAWGLLEVGPPCAAIACSGG